MHNADNLFSLRAMAIARTEAARGMGVNNVTIEELAATGRREPEIQVSFRYGGLEVAFVTVPTTRRAMAADIGRVIKLLTGAGWVEGPASTSTKQRKLTLPALPAEAGAQPAVQ